MHIQSYDMSELQERDWVLRLSITAVAVRAHAGWQPISEEAELGVSLTAAQPEAHSDVRCHHLAHAPHSLDPSEALFDHLALLLRHGVATLEAIVSGTLERRHEVFCATCDVTVICDTPR
jgi:hypothetical protein